MKRIKLMMSTVFKLLLILTLALLLLELLLLVVVIEAAGRDLVQAQDALVGVLNKGKLALVGAQTHVCNGAHDTPAVGQLEVHLVGEVAGLPANNAQDDVLVVGAGVDTRDESKHAVSGVRTAGWVRPETYPSFMTSDLERMLWTVQRASLQLLFFISVATTAPRCVTSLLRQSSAPPLP